MTEKKRRTKADTAKGQQEIMEGALEPIPSPPPCVSLNPKERGFYDIIINAKARRAWDDIGLTEAANLARTCVKLEQFQKEARKATAVIDTPAGGQVENPIFKTIDRLKKDKQTSMIRLQIHAEATNGKSDKQVTQNKSHTAAVESVGGLASGEILLGDLMPGVSVQ